MLSKRLRRSSRKSCKDSSKNLVGEIYLYSDSRQVFVSFYTVEIIKYSYSIQAHGKWCLKCVMQHTKHIDHFISLIAKVANEISFLSDYLLRNIIIIYCDCEISQEFNHIK